MYLDVHNHAPIDPGRCLERLHAPDQSAAHHSLEMLATADVDGGKASALVWRHQGDVPGRHVMQTPAGTCLIRIALGTCSFALGLGAHVVQHDNLTEGAFHVSHAGQTVYVESRTACEVVYLYVPVELLQSGDGYSAPGAADIQRDASVLQLSRVLRDCGDSGLDTSCCSYLVEALLSRISRLREQRSPPVVMLAVRGLPRWRLHRVIAYIESHIADAISLADMAEAAQLSPMHFAAQFRVSTGTNPHRYLLSCRIQKAKALLAQSPCSLIDVALSVGFRTQAHFTTVFKKIEGTTPSQWRRARLDHRQRVA